MTFTLIDNPAGWRHCTCIATPLDRNFSIIEGVAQLQTKSSRSTAKCAMCLRLGGLPPAVPNCLSSMLICFDLSPLLNNRHTSRRKKISHHSKLEYHIHSIRHFSRLVAAPPKVPNEIVAALE